MGAHWGTPVLSLHEGAVSWYEATPPGEYKSQHRTIAVGTPAWSDWLATAKSFYVSPGHARDGYYAADRRRLGYSVRRERRRNTEYWFAYKRVGGRLRSIYIGKDEDL